MIQDYKFGEIVVDNKKYNSDIIIFPNKIKTSWWRKEGHSLCYEDIKEVLEFQPEIIIIGTGASGCMEVPAETKKLITDKNIQLIIEATDKATKKYNEIKNKKVVACLHLTC